MRILFAHRDEKKWRIRHYHSVNTHKSPLYESGISHKALTPENSAGLTP